MSIKIRDENFPKPDEINELPCFTADRYLQRVDEAVRILQCCQDPNNPALVVIDFSLVGAFEFTPFCNILRVDDDTSYQFLGTQAPFAVGHFQNPDIPINTNCETYHGQVVFDFGEVIQDFLGAQEIEFELGMIGQVPMAFGVNFPSQTPTDTYVWVKGILPSPVNLEYNNGNLNIVFEYNGTIDCSCNIQCVQPTGVSANIQFCPDQQQSITILSGPLDGDPNNILLQLSDSVGNVADFPIEAVVGVDPKPPIVQTAKTPKRIEVFISRESINGVPMEEVDYQIIKYVGTNSNYFIWKDWSHRDWNHFVDYDVILGEEYGYAVRYKGRFGDISNLSAWATTTIN
ncbi:MAG: hypothetical protein ACXABY_02965 [Candidatus Thorarchaeota archaeon]|jgi:hypothetical protein